MPAKLNSRRSGAKSGRSRIRNQTPQIRNPISPVMQKVQSLLPCKKPAFQLAILIDEPLSTCQKLLCGARRENHLILSKLLRSEMGRDVLFALMGDERPDWFLRYARQLDVNAARKLVAESSRAIEALQRQASE